MVERKDETKARERDPEDARERGRDGSEDTREEYTSYREANPRAPEDPAAEREAELQPGQPRPGEEHEPEHRDE
jgi:hypothetical protein